MHDFITNEASPYKCHTSGLDLHTTVTGKCRSSPEEEQENQGESRDRLRKALPPAQKSHTTQVTASKARQGRLMNSCTVEIGQDS
ncbi:hypothetical protein TNCV_3249791 [Trichonephila clavipes]|nr:hypothetical protein TNCV_3249791 [Trichonephila clavipes]